MPIVLLQALNIINKTCEVNDMPKRIIIFLLALLLCVPVNAGAASSYSVGFDDSGWTTQTKNEYYINTDSTATICYNEFESSPDYGDIYPGSTMYIPIYVYPNGGKKSVIATLKQITADKVEIDFKALVGNQCLGDISIIDGKKLKNSGLESGAYIVVPIKDIPILSKKLIRFTLVPTVNGVPFQDSRITFTGYAINRQDFIDKNSVYGAETPMKYIVGNKYTGEATFNFGSKIKYTTRVKAKEQFYLALDRQPVSAITDMYGASGVYLDFYTFPGEYDKFSTEGKLEIPVDRSKLVVKSSSSSSSTRASARNSSSSSSTPPIEELYVYKISGKTLTALSGKQVSFNAKTNILTIYTKSLDSYVLSNQPLKKDVADSQGGILKSGYAE